MLGSLTRSHATSLRTPTASAPFLVLPGRVKGPSGCSPGSLSCPPSPQTSTSSGRPSGGYSRNQVGLAHGHAATGPRSARTSAVVGCGWRGVWGGLVSPMAGPLTRLLSTHTPSCCSCLPAPAQPPAGHFTPLAAVAAPAPASSAPQEAPPAPAPAPAHPHSPHPPCRLHPCTPVGALRPPLPPAG